MAVEIEQLKEQMTKTIGEITQLQSQIEAKKEMVNKLDGAIWGIEQERQELNANENPDAVSAVGAEAD
jgi:FtsZ-binding cell division protein ZapB